MCILRCMNLEDRTPLVTAFVRGFMDQAREGGQGLKVCGDAGRKQVEDLGMEISGQYISKLTRELASEGYIIKKRKGRSYIVAQGDRWDEYFNWLDNEAAEDWGMSSQADMDFPYRVRGINLMRLERGVRVNVKNQVEKRAFNYLMQEFRSGDLDQIYVGKDQRVVILEQNDAGKWKVATEPQYWKDIDHEAVQEEVYDMDGWTEEERAEMRKDLWG